MGKVNERKPAEKRPVFTIHSTTGKEKETMQKTPIQIILSITRWRIIHIEKTTLKNKISIYMCRYIKQNIGSAKTPLGLNNKYIHHRIYPFLSIICSPSI